MHTYFSLHYGTISPSELIYLCLEHGIDAIAVTDINNTSAILDVIRIGQRKGVRVVPGVDFRAADGRWLYTIIASCNEGFERINVLLSDYIESGCHPEALPTRPNISGTSIIYPFNSIEPGVLKEQEYIGVRTDEIIRLRLSRAYPEYKKSMVAYVSVSFREIEELELHRLLRAIDRNELISRISSKEIKARENEVFVSPKEVFKSFEEFPELIDNARELLNSSSVAFDFSDTRPPANLRVFTSSEDEDFELLKRLCWEGIGYRYPDNYTEAIRERLLNELKVIREQGYVAYFLINWDIARYARSKGYFYVGRGSGANSVVAYLLRITDVDPVDLSLYFERFINLFRKNPPDFDVDFSWQDRDDIIQYIFDKYDNVALLGTYVTYQERGIIRELGKIFGLPSHEIERLSNPHLSVSRLDETSRKVLYYAAKLKGYPSHLSIHAGGIIISEKSIHYYTATFMPPKGFPTTQFDMIIAEDVGLYKLDILSQRGLGKIRDALDIIAHNRPDEQVEDIHDIRRFKEDPKINQMLCEAKAIGCFYVESPAMRMLLTKLKVSDYLGLVAASSVIRPGVSSSGMMREYILRCRFPERRKEAHPVLLKIMPETYGVMVYQEDVIKVAHHFAGLSLAEADSLRRGMSGKYRSREEFEQVRKRFFEGAVERGHSLEDVREIWRQTESFAGYAFAKGHSASYAVESYQSLYLKCYYPLEYMVATVNNGGGFYSREFYLHEAVMQGGNIKPPCVNRSGALTTISGRDIYIGLFMIKGVEQGTVERLIHSRSREGVFVSLRNFVERVDVGIEQLSLLIRSGGFRFTGIEKKVLLWRAHSLLHKGKRILRSATLFDAPVLEYKMPQLDHDPHEDTFDQMELLGFPLSSPFDLSASPLKHSCLAGELMGLIDQEVSIYGYLVTVKRTKTVTGELMYFGTFIDVAGDFIDTVHFPDVAERFPFRGKGIYLINGSVTEEFDACSVEVSSLEKVPMVEDQRKNDMLRIKEKFKDL